VIGVLDRESSRASDVAGENANANPGKEVYLPITQTFGADNVRRQGLVEAWLAIDPRVDPEAAAPVIERALERRQHFEVTTVARLLSEHRATRGLLNRLLLLVSLAAIAIAVAATLYPAAYAAALDPVASLRLER